MMVAQTKLSLRDPLTTARIRKAARFRCVLLCLVGMAFASPETSLRHPVCSCKNHVLGDPQGLLVPSPFSCPMQSILSPPAGCRPLLTLTRPAKTYRAAKKTTLLLDPSLGQPKCLAYRRAASHSSSCLLFKQSRGTEPLVLL